MTQLEEWIKEYETLSQKRNAIKLGRRRSGNRKDLVQYERAIAKRDMLDKKLRPLKIKILEEELRQEFDQKKSDELKARKLFKSHLSDNLDDYAAFFHCTCGGEKAFKMALEC